MSVASTPSSVGCASASIGDQVLVQAPRQELVGGTALSLVFRYRVNPPLVMTVPMKVVAVATLSRLASTVFLPAMGDPFPTGAARLAGTAGSEVPQPVRARGAARSRAAAPARQEEGSDMAVTLGTAGACVADAESRGGLRWVGRVGRASTPPNGRCRSGSDAYAQPQGPPVDPAAARPPAEPGRGDRSATGGRALRPPVSGSPSGGAPRMGRPRGGEPEDVNRRSDQFLRRSE